MGVSHFMVEYPEAYHTNYSDLVGKSTINGGFHSHGMSWGTPIAGCFAENPMKKWMMTRGTPISGNLHITLEPSLKIHGIHALIWLNMVELMG